MPPAARNPAAPLVLVCGDDDFAVQQRARQLYRQWCEQAGGMDHEIIDAAAANSDQALRALAKLREALQTLPFFGSRKVIWFQSCNFLGDERTASTAAVTANLTDLAGELKAFRWEGVQLLVSAGKVDKRRTFYKTLDTLGQVEEYAGLSFEDKDWAEQAERFVHREVAARGKRIAADALGRLVAAVGPQLRQLSNEVEKLTLFVGNQPEITLDAVTRLVAPNKHAQAFGLGEALGDRDLVRALRALDEDLWEIRLKVDRNKSHIGLLSTGSSPRCAPSCCSRNSCAAGSSPPSPSTTASKVSSPACPPTFCPPTNATTPPPCILSVAKALLQTANYTAPETGRRHGNPPRVQPAPRRQRAGRRPGPAAGARPDHRAAARLPHGPALRLRPASTPCLNLMASTPARFNP
ncbi:MAG: DNA polymerase III subunit delta [Verrucomicrobia bacterium]|nr:DNA polymerase III subunit delta [Verrucomicrobiota bacterium]